VSSSWRRHANPTASGSPEGVPPEGLQVLDAEHRSAFAQERPEAGIVARYQILNEIASGAMGTVHRVLDRLSGRVVTLKRIRSLEAETSEESRLSLAQEFRFLASLRHPNVISVLDYGFDSAGEPFFTMDLAEGALSLLDGARHAPYAVQMDLLVQTLRALLYLHRHDILHCDLKPENVLIVDGQVKVLDFGLAVHRAHESESPGGTLGYIAPETFEGRPPTTASDLFSFGILAFEVLEGRHPTATVSGLETQKRLATALLDDAVKRTEPRIRPILARLLARNSTARFRDAGEVVHEFARATGLSLAQETVATRESMLQAAPLVGRRRELTKLEGLIAEARSGRGDVWVVAGESGVGKSRLLDELRTRALVSGATVVRGQAMSAGGAPYHAWREIIASLVLRCAVDEGDAPVLKPIVPDIGRIIGRKVPDPPDVDAQSASSRLLFAVEEIFRRQASPVIIILEDLQWTGSESRRVWNWLAHVVRQLPILMLGTVRSDEAPSLAAELEDTNVLPLGRLGRDSVATLGRAMIGEAGQQRDFVDFLERETEGLPFFIVEVVRSLAETSGELHGIDPAALPERVVSGGMTRMIRRRLDSLSKDLSAPLEVAAVCGREIEPRLLAALAPGIDFETWVSALAEVGIVDLRDQQVRFAHDKFREQILDGLDSDRLAALHRRVASAIEEVDPRERSRFAALAFHWGEGGDRDREASSAFYAGFVALESGACSEAVTYLNRARTLLLERATVDGDGDLARRRRWSLDPNARVSPSSVEFFLGTIEGGLAEASHRLGDLRGCRTHGFEALRRFGQRVPKGQVGWWLAAAREGARRTGQVLLRYRATDASRSDPVSREIARVQIRLSDLFVYSLEVAPLLWSGLKILNHCSPVGASSNLAQGYVLSAMMAAALPAPALANRWSRRALSIAESSPSRRDLAFVLGRVAVVEMGDCRWREADEHLLEASRIAEEVGDLRLWEECRCLVGALANFAGQYSRGLPLFREARQLSQRSGNRQVECWGMLGEADLLARTGSTSTAAELYRLGLTRVDEKTMRSEALWAHGMLALCELRLEQPAAAFDHAREALTHAMSTQPVIYYVQHGLSAMAEVLLTLEETSLRGWYPVIDLRVREACRQLARYGFRFRMGRAAAALWNGSRLWRQGRRRQAVRAWQRSIAVGREADTKYDLGRAHLELGRHLPEDDPDRAHHLEEAMHIFGSLGARYELEQVSRVGGVQADRVSIAGGME
jgi:tetratricopeptide (TPR) repeat protein